MLLDDTLEVSPALQLLMPPQRVETEVAVPKETSCPKDEGLSLDSKEKLSQLSMLEPRRSWSRWRQGASEPTSQHNAKFPGGPRKGRRKKSKEQPAACRGLHQEAEVGLLGRLHASCSRGDLSRRQPASGGPSKRDWASREGKPRAWARAWAAALEKPSSVNLESSALSKLVLLKKIL